MQTTIKPEQLTPSSSLFPVKLKTYGMQVITQLHFQKRMSVGCLLVFPFTSKLMAALQFSLVATKYFSQEIPNPCI
jgi:hypothetical protein